MFIKFKQICVLHFFFPQSEDSDHVTKWDASPRGGFLARPTPSCTSCQPVPSLSLGCLWQTMLTKQTSKNAQLAAKIQRTLSGKWEEFRAARASRRLSFFLLLLLPRVSLSSLLGWREETVFYNNSGLLTYLQLGGVWEECLLCVHIARRHWSDRLEQTQYVIFNSWVRKTVTFTNGSGLLFTHDSMTCWWCKRRSKTFIIQLSAVINLHLASEIVDWFD